MTKNNNKNKGVFKLLPKIRMSESKNQVKWEVKQEMGELYNEKWPNLIFSRQRISNLGKLDSPLFNKNQINQK